MKNNLTNAENLRGDLSNVWGDASNISGCVSNLSGCITHLSGDVTDLSGHTSLIRSHRSFCEEIIEEEVAIDELEAKEEPETSEDKLIKKIGEECFKQISRYVCGLIIGYYVAKILVDIFG